ncbi:MAG TPA: efflux RND transporter periplasmic adaptor subunit [Thermoanaerobaculia bacterium]|nr:efflux RND transporter periplasmic adaptor subunit [Thermoanaerobaculia bacterium]
MLGNRIVVSVGLALLAACGRGAPGAPVPGGAAEGGANAQPPALPVQATVAERTEIPITLTAVGSFQSPETTTVAADASGLITFLDTPEGRLVRTGHLLARLDDSVSRSALQVAEARERNARAELERVKPLYEDGVVPRSSYDNAVAELEVTAGQLAEARTRLGKNEVQAPFAGVVSLQTAQQGQYVSAGDAIVRLTKVNPLELIFTVPESDAGKVRVGQPIEGRVGRCGEAFSGVVEALDPTVDSATRTLSVQARVPNDAGVLRPGMSARVRLVVGSLGDAILVPRPALVHQGTRYLLYVVDESGTVAEREVVPGQFLIDRVEIRRGLEGGEQVIVAGHQKVRPGARVEPVPWESVENPLLSLGDREGEDCL